MTMTSLVTFLGGGKGTWVPVIQLIDSGNWEHVFLIMPQFFADKYQPKSLSVEKIVIDETKSVVVLRDELVKVFDGKIFGDVGFCCISGSGTEHMAAMAAVLKVGGGIRLVEFVGNEVKEL